MLKRKKLLLTILSAIIIISFFSLLIGSLVRISTLKRLIDSDRELILAESARQRETGDYLNNLNSMITYDLNRTRASLGLPVSEYPMRDLTEEGDVSDQQQAADRQLFDAVTMFLEAEKTNKKSAALGRFLRNENITDYLADSGIESVKITDTLFEFRFSGSMFMTVSALSESEIKLSGFGGEILDTAFASKESVYFIERILDSFKTLIDAESAAAAEIRTLLTDRDIRSAAEGKVFIEFENEQLIINNYKNSGTITAGVKVDGTEVQFYISSLPDKFSDFAAFRAELMNLIRNIDLRSDDEILLDSAKADFEKRISDIEFIEYLAEMNLEISFEPREDLDYFYYDLYHTGGKRLGSFSILKKIGEIYLVDADEVPVSSLKTLTVKKELEKQSGRSVIVPENIPQIDGLYSNSDSITFLLVGNHEKNTDTMILVHADKTTGRAYMIGIPRDLYWKGRKINSIYLNYGAEQFKKELSEITGLEISNYIIVDMYAFIDIVNILGGIEVTLEEDLIDPTYRTRENGEWSTLNYPRGTYNLNGIEALRVARSRHGSNDFERSKRQQQILEAFLNKIQQLSISDANKVYAMIQAMFDYIDTDFTFLEIMSIFTEYGDSELSGKHVLSFDNILYDTYSNIYMLEDQDVEFDSDFNKGAWILFPVDNDWNNIRWYVRGIINGDIK